jgi:hypothetical protein
MVRDEHRFGRSGELTPNCPLILIRTVFTSSETGVAQISWEGLYDAYQP